MTAGSHRLKGAGILPWPSGTAMAAAVRMFREWLERRGTPGALESMRAISQVRAVIERHGASRFVVVDQDGPVTPSAPVQNRLGYVKRSEGREVFYVLPEMFRNEVCKGLDHKRVSAELVRIGALTPNRKGERATSEYLHGIGQKRCYVIDGEKLFETEDA